MDRPVSLLHVVGREQVHDAGKLQQQPVLETKHRGGPDNGGLGEDIADYVLRTALQTELGALIQPQLRASCVPW